MSLLSGRSDINYYAQNNLPSFPNITAQKIIVRDTNLTLTPFDGWNVSYSSKSLKFWNDYYLIKNEREAIMANISTGIT